MFEVAIEILKNKISQNEILIGAWQNEEGEDDYCDLLDRENSELQQAIEELKKAGEK
jgi:galactose-1-phosphate uridylyltransferase